MKRVRFGSGFAIAGGLAAAVLAASPAKAAPTLHTLVTFDFDPGATPYAGVTAIGDRLYGVTKQGGHLQQNKYGYEGYGDIYSLPTKGGAYTSLDQFFVNTGTAPSSNLTAVGNVLYGTTPTDAGGFSGDIYSISTSPGNLLRNVATFNTQIVEAQGSLTAIGATLYGVASGGAFGEGVIYSVPTSGGSLHAVYNFNGITSDKLPSGPLLAVGNTLYGVAAGGYAGDGTVYSYNLSTHTYTTLGSFNGANGANPHQGVILAGNRLYGTTERGGAGDSGTVFSVPVTGGAITSLASFAVNSGAPSRLTLVGNLLYGTQEYSGGANGDTFGEGGIFTVPVSGGNAAGKVKTIVTFDDFDGAVPSREAGLTLVGDSLYGTTTSNGSPYFGQAADPGYGTVFSLAATALVAVSKSPFSEFGGQVGGVSVISGDGLPQSGRVRFSPTATGYVAVSDPNAAHDVETFSLHVRDSAPESLESDLADLAWELNAGTYDGFDLTATWGGPVIDPDNANGAPGGGYNLFIAITNTGAGAGSPYFGFDLTQLMGTDDTLTVDGLSVSAAAAVPEPSTWAMMLIGFAGLGVARRRARTLSSQWSRRCWQTPAR